MSKPDAREQAIFDEMMIKLLRHENAELRARLSEVEREIKDACETAKERRDEAYLQRVRAEAAEARLSEVEKALEDTVAFIQGDIQGPVQRDGILKEARATLHRKARR